MDDHDVDPAQQGGGARDAGLGALRPAAAAAVLACREPAAAWSSAASAAWVIAWYLAAMTGLNWSIGHTARQTVSRRPGRPRREMCASPRNAPEALSDGDIPACLTSDDGVVIAARVTGLGQDRRRAHGRQGGDVRQAGQAELIQHCDHVRLDGAQLGTDPLQVTQLVSDPAQQAAPRPGDDPLGCRSARRKPG